MLYLVQQTFLYQSIYILQKNIKSIGKGTLMWSLLGLFRKAVIKIGKNDF